MSKKVSIAPDVDWDAIVEVTEGYSGADLQAVVYNAHLEVITSSLEKKSTTADPKGKGKGKAREDVVEEVNREEDKPIEYLVVGGPDGGKPRSRAEEIELQRRVCGYKRLAQQWEVSDGFILIIKVKTIFMNYRKSKGFKEDIGSKPTPKNEVVSMILLSYILHSQ